MQFARHMRTRFAAAFMCLAVSSLHDASAETTAPAATAAPALGLTTPELFAAEIHTAVLQRDLTTLEKLVDWDGASPFKRRWVLFEMRKAFSRKLRSVTAEPFPKDALASIAEFGPFKVNMDVTVQVRIVFDEPTTKYGASSDILFLGGKQGAEYRIALVNPITPEAHQ